MSFKLRMRGRPVVHPRATLARRGAAAGAGVTMMVRDTLHVLASVAKAR